MISDVCRPANLFLSISLSVSLSQLTTCCLQSQSHTRHHISDQAEVRCFYYTAVSLSLSLSPSLILRGSHNCISIFSLSATFEQEILCWKIPMSCSSTHKGESWPGNKLLIAISLPGYLIPQTSNQQTCQLQITHLPSLFPASSGGPLTPQPPPTHHDTLSAGSGL